MTDNDISLETENIAPKPKSRTETKKVNPILKRNRYALKKGVEKQKHVDMYHRLAKLLAVKNHNEHLVVKGHPELTVDDVFVVWFSKVLGNWKALVATNYSDGLYYEITNNHLSEETYVDVYRRIAHSSVPYTESNALLDEEFNK